MKRDELEHVLRAAGAITGVSTWVIVGSQAILGAVPNAPAELLVSQEVDLYAPADEAASDLVDGSIGEVTLPRIIRLLRSWRGRGDGNPSFALARTCRYGSDAFHGGCHRNLSGACRPRRQQARCMARERPGVCPGSHSARNRKCRSDPHPAWRGR